jgi:hypothetical protein
VISRPKQLTGALEVSTLLLLFALFSCATIARRHDEGRASRITHPFVNTRLSPASSLFLLFIHGFPSPPLLVPQPTHNPHPPPPCHNSSHRFNKLSPLTNALKSHGVVIPHSDTASIIGSEKKNTAARREGLRISHVSCSAAADRHWPQKPHCCSSLATLLVTANPATLLAGDGKEDWEGRGRIMSDGLDSYTDQTQLESTWW